MAKPRLAYKLFRLRSDGTLGPLFVNRAQVVPVGRWVAAEAHRHPRLKFRPGWHAVPRKRAPHLSRRGRVWARVELLGVCEYQKPAAQGGTWLLARRMRVLEVLG